MKKREVVPCCICKKPVKQETSTAIERQTCHRVLINGVLEKSECEKEKNRRYQKKYRDSGKKPKSVLDRSVALSSVKHLAKHKAKKYKRHCLKCTKKFIGIGKYNRVCNSCTIENSRQSNLKGGG
jgi:hypothetical protein